MPYNGNGVYALPAPDYPAVPGTTITAESRNVIDADIAEALSLALTRDGQAQATNNIPMGGFGFQDLGSISAAVGGCTFTGNFFATTQVPGTANTTLATTAFVANQAFNTALPAQAGNAGKFVTTNGTTATWTDTITIPWTMSGAAFNQAKGADIPSASTVNLQAATGNFVHITGTTQIDAVTLNSGAERTVVFDGILTLKHSANLVLPTAADIVTAAGDTATFRGDGAVVRVLDYQRNSGLPVAPQLVGNHEVTVHTGNGYGSTNTMIRRFSTVLTNVGTAVTYADSATNGASFTINETGLYSLYYSDNTAGAGISWGISVNSAQLTTSILTINIADRLAGVASTQASELSALTRTVRLVAGDVVRPHTNGAASPGTTNQTYFSIRKVGVSG